MLRQAIQGISDLILVPGLINLDFADVKTIMSGMGMAMMGTGVGRGRRPRHRGGRTRAISSPLLEDASVNGARGVIINVTGGPDISLIEVSEASTIIQEAAHEDANIIFGAVVDPRLEGRVKITVIATGFDKPGAVAPPTSSRTPVDLHNYVSQRQEVALDDVASHRVAIGRRPGIELPVIPSGLAAARGGRRRTIPSLDVPAFLRRQTEAEPPPSASGRTLTCARHLSKGSSSSG